MVFPNKLSNQNKRSLRVLINLSDENSTSLSDEDISEDSEDFQSSYSSLENYKLPRKGVSKRRNLRKMKNTSSPEKKSPKIMEKNKRKLFNSKNEENDIISPNASVNDDKRQKEVTLKFKRKFSVHFKDLRKSLAKTFSAIDNCEEKCLNMDLISHNDALEITNNFKNILKKNETDSLNNFKEINKSYQSWCRNLPFEVEINTSMEELFEEEKNSKLKRKGFPSNGDGEFSEDDRNNCEKSKDSSEKKNNEGMKKLNVDESTLKFKEIFSLFVKNVRNHLKKINSEIEICEKQCDQNISVLENETKTGGSEKIPQSPKKMKKISQKADSTANHEISLEKENFNKMTNSDSNEVEKNASKTNEEDESLLVLMSKNQNSSHDDITGKLQLSSDESDLEEEGNRSQEKKNSSYDEMTEKLQISSDELDLEERMKSIAEKLKTNKKMKQKKLRESREKSELKKETSAKKLKLKKKMNEKKLQESRDEFDSDKETESVIDKKLQKSCHVNLNSLNEKLLESHLKALEKSKLFVENEKEGRKMNFSTASSIEISSDDDDEIGKKRSFKKTEKKLKESKLKKGTKKDESKESDFSSLDKNDLSFREEESNTNHTEKKKKTANADLDCEMLSDWTDSETSVSPKPKKGTKKTEKKRKRIVIFSNDSDDESKMSDSLKTKDEEKQNASNKKKRSMTKN